MSESKNPSASFYLPSHESFTPPPISDSPFPSFGLKYGLTFQQARTAIVQSLTEVCQECHGQHSPITYIDNRMYVLCITGLIVVSLYIASYCLSQSPSSGSGLLFTVIVTGVVIITNIIAIILYKKSYSVEVYQALQQVSKQYQYYVEKQLIQDFSAAAENDNNLPLNPNHTLLPTGHSQISIVNTFRNGQWLKLPILLLAEGDIVALMGGDVTPCRVVELKEQLSTAGPNSTSSLYSSKNMENMTWVEEETFAHGVKIHIDEDLHRKHHHHHHHHKANGNVVLPTNSSKKSEYEYDREIRQKVTIATPTMPIMPMKSNERHRTLDPESIEILRLCGNIRCFKLLETPMKEFVRKTYETQCVIPQQRGGLFVHKLRCEVHVEYGWYAVYLLLLLALVCLVRISVSSHMLDKYSIGLFIPIATTLILCSASVLPILFMLMEAFGTAEILTTLEVAHHTATTNSNNSNAAGKTTTTTTGNTTHGNKSPVSETQPSKTNDKTSATREDLSTNKKSKKSAANEVDLAADNHSQASSQQQQGDDEFVDEDIDARVEDLAEETATKVMYFRFFRYVMKVLWTRLVGGISAQLPVEYANDSEIQPLFPIPLARTNIVEQLGAITMVCFVDDDIISENYSVTEEIFLLNDHHEFSPKDPHHHHHNNNNNSNMNSHGGVVPPSDKSKLSSNMSSSMHHQVQKGLKSTVLDLHANPEATGSRFENPLWWKYLPCLKPLGLNALLTYKYTAEQLSIAGGNSGHPAGHAAGNCSPITASNRPAFEIEKSLVQHIRKTLPLEFLRELAEEIGFVEDDVKYFTRALEVNVLAPGLENAHLLEDNHQWGQEESRRRGSLLPHLRGAIYRDIRGGSLQMMSLGDPSLVLHYCREYWDGNTCSIVPLSHADRTEVLSVYERWRLEDFDVVAFAYTPMPMFAMQYLLDPSAASNNGGNGNTGGINPNNASSTSLNNNFSNSGGSRKRSGSQAITPNNSQNNLNSSNHGHHHHNAEAKSSTWFFVDPSSVQDLNGGKGRSRDSSAPTSVKTTLSTATNNNTNSTNTAAANNSSNNGNGSSGATTIHPGLGKSLLLLQADGDKTTPATQQPQPHHHREDGDVEDKDDDGDLLELNREDGDSAAVRRSVTINHLPTILDEDGDEEQHRSSSSARKDDEEDDMVVELGDRNHIDNNNINNNSNTGNNAGNGSEAGPSTVWTSLLKRSMSDSNLLLRSTATSPLTASSSKLKQVGTSSDLISADSNYLVMPFEANQSAKTERISLAASSVFSVDSNPDLSPSNMSSASHFFPISMDNNSNSAKLNNNNNAMLSTPPRLHMPIAEDNSSSVGQISPLSLLKSISLEESLSMLASQPQTRSRRRSCSHSDVVALSNSSVAMNADFDSSAVTAISTRSRRTSTTTVLFSSANNNNDNNNNSNNDNSGNDNSPMPAQVGLDLDSLVAPSSSSDNNNNNNTITVATAAVRSSSRGPSPLLISTSEKLTSSTTARRSPTAPNSNPNSNSNTSNNNSTSNPNNNNSTPMAASTRTIAASTTSSRKVHRDRSTTQHNTFFKAQRRSALKQLWTLMRQQIFLGMAASSVPVRKDVPNMKEDLDAAGIRFVYFSPQNMKRSKPVAEKIGIPFDWNCAISLRILDSDQHDPHRHISAYADWDVLARMPHGIEAIKQHLKTVDNVPLLVSLFTDATPDTIQQMIGIFRENDEVVLAIGSGYRAYNQSIFCSANISSSVSTLPNVMSFIPAQEQDLLDQFPATSSVSLTKSDLQLSFDLVSLGSLNLLQGHSFYRHMKVHPGHHVDVKKPESDIEHLQLSVLLETIRKGRVLLLNEMQALAFLVITSLGLSLWPLLAHVIPVSMPLTCPPPMAIVFVLLYLPCIGLSMIFSDDHEGVMKTTPRKSSFVRKAKDQSRFYQYVATRVFTIIFAIILTGYFTAASVFQTSQQSYLQSLSHYHHIFQTDSAMETVYHSRGYWLVQDMMCHAALLSVVAQSFSLLSRGQRFWHDFPWPRYYQEYYTILAVIFVLHACIMAWRAGLRSCAISQTATRVLVGEYFCEDMFQQEDVGDVKYRYQSLHFVAYLVLFLSSILCNLWSGFWINVDDRYHYRRYLQFLRLEFDTRLGMHSPR